MINSLGVSNLQMNSRIMVLPRLWLITMMGIIIENQLSHTQPLRSLIISGSINQLTLQ